MKRIRALVTAAGMMFSFAGAWNCSIAALDFERVYRGVLTFLLYDDYASLFCCDNEAEGIVEIPSQVNGKPVTTVSNRAFRECNKVTSIRLPASITSIAPAALNTAKPAYNQILMGESFSSLLEITIPDANSFYCSIDGVLFTKDMKLLVQYPAGKQQSKYTVPVGVEAIGSCAFSGSSVSEIHLPNSLRIINDEAFWCWCGRGSSIVFPANLKIISKKAFGNVQFSSEVVIPESVDVIGSFAFFYKAPSSFKILNPQCCLDGTIITDTREGEYTGIIRGYDNSTAKDYAKKTIASLNRLASLFQKVKKQADFVVRISFGHFLKSMVHLQSRGAGL